MNHTKRKDAKKENMIITLIFWLVLFCVGMASMLFVASRKTIVIADAAQEQVGLAADTEGDYGAGRKELLLQKEDAGTGNICIPLEKGIKAENVVMENRYMDQELWIYIQAADESFYGENAIYGDIVPVESGYCEAQRDGIILKMQMSGVLEYRSTMEDDTLVIAYCDPRELYEQIVVIDPAGGGSDKGVTAEGYTEKELTLQVARMLQRKLEQDTIKVYYTRLEDTEVSRESRAALVESVDADLFIRIGACVDAEHTEYYGIQSCYNEEYFIPEFGNVQLADVLTRNVTVSASNRAVGLFPAGEESILSDIKIPAAELYVGYMSNPQENLLLQQESYQEKLAEGLANAILEVYTILQRNPEDGIVR